MLDSNDQLLQRIRLGEDSSLELKAVVFAGDSIKGPSRDALADELAAFANAKGGVVILGVDDKAREISGIPLEKLDAVEKLISEVCHDSIKGPLFVSIRRVELPVDDATHRIVMRVDVPASVFVHSSPGGYFYRMGSSKRPMSPEHLARLLQHRSQAGLIRFDQNIFNDATVADLDGALVDRFRTERTDDEPVMLMRKLGMIKLDEDGTPRPTVAGVLLACREPRSFMPNAFIQAVAYRSAGGEGVVPGPGYQLDHRDISGPLDVQIIEACRFVARNMRIEASKFMGRVDVPQYDLAAVFEAVVNAVAHRDYSMGGSKIRLRMFADRLELMSPGALPNTLEIGDLAYRQATRNETVTSLLAKIPAPRDIEGLQTRRDTLMDRRGEGVAMILGASERLSKKRPEYVLLGESELKLTIFAASALDQAGPTVLET